MGLNAVGEGRKFVGDFVSQAPVEVLLGVAYFVKRGAFVPEVYKNFLHGIFCYGPVRYETGAIVEQLFIIMNIEITQRFSSPRVTCSHSAASSDGRLCGKLLFAWIQKYAWDETSGYFGYVTHDASGIPQEIMCDLALRVAQIAPPFA